MFLQVLRPSIKVKDMFFWTDIYMPLSSSINGLGCPSSLNGSLNLTTSYMKENSSAESHDSKDESEAETKHVDVGVSVNETESDMETIASDKQQFHLVKTRSCENMNSLEDDSLYENELSLTRTRHCSDPNLFRTLCVGESTSSSVKSVDILKYLRDLRIKDVTTKRDTNGHEYNQLTFNRVNGANEASENCDTASMQFSMLSTETLLNGNSLSEDTRQESSENSGASLILTASTSTTELSSSCVQNSDLTHLEKLYHSVYCQRRKHGIPASHHNASTETNATACNNCFNGKHTRTPSSGCYTSPATPNEDQYSDASPSPIDKNFNHTWSNMYDVDGEIRLRDKVQTKLHKIMSQHKVSEKHTLSLMSFLTGPQLLLQSEIEALRKELYMARLALCQQFQYCSFPKENDHPQEEVCISERLTYFLKH